MNLICIDPAIVEHYWPNVSHLILAAMRKGGLSSYQPVEDAVLAGRALLWLVADDNGTVAAAVTQLEQTEWRKVCLIVACAGKGMADWLPLIAGIEKFAKAEGCAAVRIVGRKGWARVLKDYRATRVILEKELN